MKANSQFSRIGRSYPAPDRRGASLGLHGTDSVRATDAFSNAAARMGFGTPSLAEQTEYKLERISMNYWLLITLYRNHWISRSIVDIPAQDMTKAWPRLTSDVDPKDLTRIDRALRNTGTKERITKALSWGRLFGGAGALMVIDGQENMLEEPLDLDSIEPGAYRGIIPFDRWAGISTDGTVSNDISRPLEFNLPEFYTVQSPEGGSGYRVHASRVLRFCGPSVPAPEHQVQNGWGISCLEPPYEEIVKRDNMSWNILSLTFRASIFAMKEKGMDQMLSGASMNTSALQAFQARMTTMNQLLSNNSMLMLGENGGLESLQYAFGGLSDVYQQFQLDIAGAARIPVTRLYGRTLSGLGQSNDADERIYEENIALEQHQSLLPQLDRLYAVICMSALGEVPNDLDLTFPSVRVLDEKEKSDLAKTTGDNVINAYNAGLITKPMALKELKQSSDVTGAWTNITDEDIAAAEREEEMLPAQGDTPPAGEKPEAAEPAAEEGQGNGVEELKKLARASDSLVVKQLDFAGIPLSIEYLAGSRRRLRNAQGRTVYDANLKHHYGFIDGTIGRDGDEIDVIVGPDATSKSVYVVDMIDLGPDVHQREDEDKVMLGFPSSRAAKDGFLSMYPESFFGGMNALSLDAFKQNWLGA